MHANVKFAILALLLQAMLIILYTFGVDYDDRAKAVNDGNPAIDMGTRYAFYQDVHVMIFVGFGFLMTFLYRHGFSAVGYNLMVAVFSIQWAILARGFFHNLYNDHWERIPVSLESLIAGDFAAASVLITFGAVLGKVNAFQLLTIAVVEIVLFSLNETIGVEALEVTDIGGSMFVHAFGAYFGLACAWMIGSGGSTVRDDLASNAASDQFSMIGTLFLWMFWPSFNAALADHARQHRAVINTLLSISASAFVTFAGSAILRPFHKFSMVDVQNATLAGGVAVGAAADLMLEPYGALLIGSIGGLISVFGFAKLMPYLEERFSLFDTCGVHNLHGMPAVFSGIVCAIASATTGEHSYGNNAIGLIYSARDERTAGEQGGYQMLALVMSVGVALIGGTATGWLVRRKEFSPPENLYDDLGYWWTEEDEEAEQLEKQRQREMGSATAHLTQ